MSPIREPIIKRAEALNRLKSAIAHELKKECLGFEDVQTIENMLIAYKFILCEKAHQRGEEMGTHE